ncbi:Putative gustatory receptor 28b [Cyphomyrmex costatus]|uniref:Gustatory receptor n=1 Tax=Cyphomyrmex costatus TaxID=456900 RepID=A0A195CUD2_9HYME|nr:Putative gustatory receptor 28b [Cyphomyrmex costatus]
MWKRYWLFRATDFQSLMYPCFTFCRILGIFPYKINASTFEISKRYLILFTMVICACGIFDVLIIYESISEFNLLGITKTLEIVSYYACNGFVMIITHILSGPRMRLLQTILKISSKLPPESYQKLSILIHVKDIFGTIFLAVQMNIYYLRNDFFELNYKAILVVIFTTYLTLLEFEINMLYINCVCVLKACFKRLNENVAYLQRLVIKPCVICHVQRNQFLLLTQLNILQKQHLMISNAVQMLNLIFSLQLHATIVMTFFDIIFEIYYYVVRWQNGLYFTFDMHFLDVFLISITFYILKVTLITWACETGKNQAQKIGTTIHDVLNSTNNELIKNKLQQFSLQILHCKNIFLTKGLTINATLLTAMVGGIMTYMLILIQFLIASHSCDGTSITNNSSVLILFRYRNLTQF